MGASMKTRGSAEPIRGDIRRDDLRDDEATLERDEGTGARRGLGRRGLLTALSGLAGAAVGSAAGVAFGYRYSPQVRTVKLAALAAPLELPEGMSDFRTEAEAIFARHRAQTEESVAALKARYEGAVFGRVHVWDLVEKLALCVDPSDMRLFCGSQFVHLQQILAAMERNGVSDPDMLLLAVIHDLGKVLLLEGEAPENVVCTTRHIGSPEPGCGLENVVFQFGHGEFIYSRIRGHVPDHVAWVARYHNVKLADVEPYMNDRDRAFADQYLRPFRRYDGDFVSPYFLPKVDLERYRALVESYFPSPLLV
jgi:hypothetical protein